MSNPGRPERTCMGCGRKALKERLLRFVVGEDGSLELDLDQTRPGRGGYFCPEKECFLLAARRKRLSVRFRREVKVDPEGWLEQAHRRLKAEEPQGVGAREAERCNGEDKTSCSDKPAAEIRGDLSGERLRSLDGGGGSEWPR